MALPDTIKPNGVGDVQTGVRLEVVPSDENTQHELQRANDSGGSPGTWIVIAYLGTGQNQFVDLRPLGTIWHYRVRGFRPDADPSAWAGDLADPDSTSVRVQAVQLGIESPEDQKRLETSRALETIMSADAELVSTISIDEGATSVKIARHTEQGIAQHSSGEASVSFSESYTNAPVVTLIPHQLIMFNKSLNDTSPDDQYLRLQALDVSASGFTVYAKNAKTGVVTAQWDDFPAHPNHRIDAQGETVEVNLDPGGASSNQYTIHWKGYTYVYIDLLGVGKATLTVVIAIDTNDGGGWIERTTITYIEMQIDQGTSSTNYTHEQKTINVSGLGLNDDIRLRAKSVTFTDTSGVGGYSWYMDGFNKSTDGDVEYGCTYNTATDVEESAMPDAEDGAKWIAQETN